MYTLHTNPSLVHVSNGIESASHPIDRLTATNHPTSGT